MCLFNTIIQSISYTVISNKSVIYINSSKTLRSVQKKIICLKSYFWNILRLFIITGWLVFFWHNNNHFMDWSSLSSEYASITFVTHFPKMLFPVFNETLIQRHLNTQTPSKYTDTEKHRHFSEAHFSKAHYDAFPQEFFCHELIQLE